MKLIPLKNTAQKDDRGFAKIAFTWASARCLINGSIVWKRKSPVTWSWTSNLPTGYRVRDENGFVSMCCLTSSERNYTRCCSFGLVKTLKLRDAFASGRSDWNVSCGCFASSNESSRAPNARLMSGKNRAGLWRAIGESFTLFFT